MLEHQHYAHIILILTLFSLHSTSSKVNDSRGLANYDRNEREKSKLIFSK